MIKSRLSALLVALSLAVPVGLAGQTAAATSGLSVDLNIPTGRVVVRDGAKVIRTYPVSVGQRGHDTPTGEFTISRAEWNPWWRPPEREWAKDNKVTPPGPDNPMGRVKLFFAPYYYLHGTPEEKSLGMPASHGCVRMRNADAIELGKLLQTRADASVPASAIPRILARSSNTRWVDFGAPVPLRIRYEPVVVTDGELRVYPDVYNYGSVHSEGVYQALMGAGYDIRNVSRAQIDAVLERAAKKKKGIFSVPLTEAFGGSLALRGAD